MNQLVLLPNELTAENGAKYALTGEFQVTEFIECGRCDHGDASIGDEEEFEACEFCDGQGGHQISITIDWPTIKEIYTKAVKHFTKNGGATEIPFNANEYVKVKLNQRGVKTLEAQHEDLQLMLHSSVRKPFKLSLDENGYYKDQLWHLMQTFGGHLCMGIEPPFDMNFQLLQPSHE